MRNRTRHGMSGRLSLATGALLLAVPGTVVFAQAVGDVTGEPGGDAYWGEPPPNTEADGDAGTGGWDEGADALPEEPTGEQDQMRVPFGGGLDPAPGTEPYEPPSYAAPLPEAEGQADYGAPSWVPGGAEAYPAPGSLGGPGAPAMPDPMAPQESGPGETAPDAGAASPGTAPAPGVGDPPAGGQPGGAGDAPNGMEAPDGDPAGEPSGDDTSSRTQPAAPSTESFDLGP